MLAFIINKCPELLVLQKESIQGMGGEEAPEVLCSPLFTFAVKGANVANTGTKDLRDGERISKSTYS